VRIGDVENSRISAGSNDLLLSNQMEAWRTEALKKGSQFIEDWAVKHNISKRDFDISTSLRKLSLANEAAKQLAALISLREKQMADLVGTNPLATTHNETRDPEEIAQIKEDMAKLRTDLKGYNSEQVGLKDSLRKLDSMLDEIVELPDEELRVWAEDYCPANAAYKEFKRLVDIFVEWENRFGRSSEFHGALLSCAQIVAGTCVGMAVRGIQDVEFDLCIVDEASKASATETLVPLARSHKWVLVGDQQQLPPFLDEQLKKPHNLEPYGLTINDLRNTLFDRLAASLPKECQTGLYVQHRMVPPIGDLISECFYDGKLKSAPKALDTTLIKLFPKPVTWIPPPPSAHGQAGAKSKHDARLATIPAPSSASRKAAAGPSSSIEHALDGSFACSHYAATPVVMKVSEKVHLYTVTDLVNAQFAWRDFRLLHNLARAAEHSGIRLIDEALPASCCFRVTANPGNEPRKAYQLRAQLTRTACWPRINLTTCSSWPSTRDRRSRQLNSISSSGSIGVPSSTNPFHV